MSDISLKVVGLIENVGRLMQACATDLGEEDRSLTVNQVFLLKILSVSKRMTMADLAQSLRITPASATSLVERMVKSGWLERSDDPSDRRKVWISIVPSRLEQWEKQEKKHRDSMVKFNSVLSESELKQLASILEHLIKRNS
jgi:DNA-binding MarR family transcriptional regulator